MEGKRNEIAVVDNMRRGLQVKDAAWNSLSDESKSAYSSDYKFFFKFVKKDPKDVTAPDVLEYIEFLEKNNYKNSSINRKIASISKMFKVMIIAGEIKTNPVDVLKQFKNISHKTSRSVSISLDIKDIKRTVKITSGSSIQEHKMSLIIRMLAMTGLRISEFTGIKRADIYNFDEENKIINIVGKGKKERKVYVSNEFLGEVEGVYPPLEDVEYLFYTLRKNRYNRKTLWRQVKDFFYNKIEKDVHPHMLRHFFATHKINVEKQDIKAVSKFLGHSDVSITLNAYVDTALDVKSSKIKI
jgi:integrase/recombinase XerD